MAELRGLYLKLTSGRMVICTGDGQGRTAKGEALSFAADEVEGIADWDAIERFRKATLPTSRARVLPGQRRLEV